MRILVTGGCGFIRMGYISKGKLEEVAETMRNSTYGDYLLRLLKE